MDKLIDAFMESPETGFLFLKEMVEIGLPQSHWL